MQTVIITRILILSAPEMEQLPIPVESMTCQLLPRLATVTPSAMQPVMFYDSIKTQMNFEVQPFPSLANGS